MQLAITVNKRLIKPVPYFATFTDTALLAIVAKLKPLIFVPAQVVVKEGTALKAIYFVNRGIAQILRNLPGSVEAEAAAASKESVIGVLKALDHFGLESFVKRGKTKMSVISVRTVTYCDMMGLAITDLMAIIAANNLEWAQEKAVQATELAAEKAKLGSLKPVGVATGFIRRLKAAGNGVQTQASAQAAGGGGVTSTLSLGGAASALVAASPFRKNAPADSPSAKPAKRCQFAAAAACALASAKRAQTNPGAPSAAASSFSGTVAALVAQARANAVEAAEDDTANKPRGMRAQSRVRTGAAGAQRCGSGGGGLGPNECSGSGGGGGAALDAMSIGERTRGQSFGRQHKLGSIRASLATSSQPAPIVEGRQQTRVATRGRQPVDSCCRLDGVHRGRAGARPRIGAPKPTRV